ncbi:MAG: MFS transporter [Chloroflexota bacterium]
MIKENADFTLNRLLFFTFCRTMFNTMYRMVYPFLNVFRQGLGVSLDQMSVLLTLRAALGAVVPFLASMGDSRGRKTGMLTGSGLFLIGTGLVVIFPTYWAFFAAILLTMVGKYIFDPSLLALVGDRVRYSERGRVMALMELGWSFSFLFGVPLVGLVIARNGWLAPFPLFLVLSVLVIYGLYRTLPQDGERITLPVGEKHRFLQLLTSTIALNGLLIGLCISAANETINLVFGVWLEDTFGLKIAALGAATAVIGISELAGEFLVAGLVDRIGKPRTVVIGILINSLAAVGLPLLSKTVYGAVAGLFFFYISFEFTLVSSIPLMSELLPETRATMLSATGASHSVGRAVGALIATRLYQIGISANITASVLLNGIAILALWMLTRRKSL